MSLPRPDRRLSTRAFVMLAAPCLLLGLGVLVYRGPGRALVRGALGDVLVVAFLYFALGAIARWQPRTRLWAVGGLALLTELSQLVPRGVRSTAVDLTVGATFDPLDLLCYALGLALAWTVEMLVIRRTGAAVDPAHQAGHQAVPHSAHHSAHQAAHQPAHQPDQ
jgi:hypothetical protein